MDQLSNSNTTKSIPEQPCGHLLDVDYAMLVKFYGESSEQIYEKRYGPANYSGSEKRVIKGGTRSGPYFDIICQRKQSKQSMPKVQMKTGMWNNATIDLKRRWNKRCFCVAAGISPVEKNTLYFLKSSLLS